MNPLSSLVLMAGIVLGRARTQPVRALTGSATAFSNALGASARFLGPLLYGLAVAAAKVGTAIRGPFAAAASMVVGMALLAEAEWGGAAGLLIALWLLAKRGGRRGSRGFDPSSHDLRVLQRMTGPTPSAPSFDEAAYEAQLSAHPDAELRRMARRIADDLRAGRAGPHARQDTIRQRHVIYRALDDRRARRPGHNEAIGTRLTTP